MMKDQLNKLARGLHLGVIVYRLYYAPKGFVQKGFREGFINMALTYQARLKMEKAAYQLEPIKGDVSDLPLEIHFLSGKRFWYQSCFCAYSMIQHAKTNLCPVIYDDGTLGKKYAEAIQRIFPNVKIISSEAITARLDEYLPENKFPVLRRHRIQYPHLRKLTDIHAGSRGWKLVLDSDMLFFQAPNFLLDWLKFTQKPCHMVDVASAYGYSDALMSLLTKAKIPECLNVGICGLRSEDIDWEKLEFWCKSLIEQEGTHYYQEQALTAMLLADKSCAIAPAEQYVVLPEREEVMNPQAVLHHYVADSKTWYFRHGWKHIFNHYRQLKTT